MNDPYQLLGIGRDADDTAVRAAYLAAVRLCPPERDAVRFAALHKAFAGLATSRQRLAHDLFDRQPPTLAGVLHRLESGFTPGRPQAATLLRALKGGTDGR